MSLSNLLAHQVPIYTDSNSEDNINELEIDSHLNKLGIGNVARLAEYLKKCKQPVQLFNNCIQFYAYSEDFKPLSVKWMSNFISNKYNFLGRNILTIGQDLIGNQFCVDGKGFYLMSIETASFEVISQDIEDWADKLLVNWRHYSCNALYEDMTIKDSNFKLMPVYRLAPKKLFSMGGEYIFENVYQMDIEKLIDLMSAIAVQIYNIPDGAKIRIVLK